MIDIVCFDLDSTIANTLHRQWMIPGIKEYKPGGPTWDDYSMACSDDTPIAGTVALMRILTMDNPLFIITGRNEVARELTLDWLSEHLVPFDILIMRPSGSHEKNSDFKVRKIGELRAAGLYPVLFVEDFPLVAAEITKATGIPVLLVNPGYYEGAPGQTVAGA